jgi:hypothetical protein
MPLVFAMFILYFFSCYLHWDPERLHAMDQAVSFDLKENANFAFGGDFPFENGRMGHKNLFDINSIADFWSYMDLGLTPLFWAEDWELSETRSNVYARCNRPEMFQYFGWSNSSTMPLHGHAYDDVCPQAKPLPPRPSQFYANNNRGTYLYYNSAIGGVRLRQERSEPEDCPNADDTLLSVLFRGVCVPEQGYFLKPDRYSALFINEDMIDKSGGETVYLQSRTPQSMIREQLHALEDRVWFSPNTAKVEVLFTMYNAHLDLFSATYLVMFVNRGGHMFKMVEPMSTFIIMYRHPLSYVSDILLMLLIFKIAFDEGREIFRLKKVMGGMKAGLKEYLGPANFIDWCVVFYFFVLMAVWLRHVSIVGELYDSLLVADATLPGSFSNDSDRDKYYLAVDNWMTSEKLIRLVASIFPLVIGGRFFKVFSLQPRLGVVTATLHQATLDIVHFMMVFGSIFLVFVFSAMIIFGTEVEDFANFGRATNAVFLIMTGVYDWESVTSVVSRRFSAVWFWGFTWLVNLIMLNMLLAIVMDVYTQVKGHIPHDAETMWSQVTEIIHRHLEIRAGRQISLEYVLENLEKHHPEGEESEEERVTIERFMKIVPAIPHHQALRLLVCTFQDDAEEDSGRGGSISETSSRVQHIFKNTQVLQSSIERLIHMHELTADLMNTNFAEIRYHQHHKHLQTGQLLEKVANGNL